MTVRPNVAIACGGTGGHFFPGLAVARELRLCDCDVTLWISHKTIDRYSAKAASSFNVCELPAVAFSSRAPLRFLRGMAGALTEVHRKFGSRPPDAVLAMGGFTSIAPILLGRLHGAITFLHESNTIPGRANRLLGPWVDEVFVGFAEAWHRLPATNVTVTGTPVRAGFTVSHPAPSREALGLDSMRPTVLFIGGSQGARGLNRLVLAALPALARANPQFQFLHLTGVADEADARDTYQRLNLRAVVHAFLDETSDALAAASVVVSRAGASSLAELAASRRPAILVPYPSAVDDHQNSNAHAFQRAGAARILDEATATPEALAMHIQDLTQNAATSQGMQAVLADLHVPDAAADIAARVLRRLNNPASTCRPVGFSLAVS